MARATRMPRAIVDIDEFVEPKNLMIYGDTGAGKTEIIGHLPGKVLVLESEDNVRVIRRAAARLGCSEAEIKKRFKVWAIRSWQDLEDAYVWVRDNPDAFDWVAIDSATSVQQRAMRAAMEKAVAHNPEKRDIDLPDRGEHQKMQNAMKRMIADFNELPVNVLWLAQAMRREDKDGNEIVLPFVMGKDYEISAWTCAQMQAFAYYAKRPKKVSGSKKSVTERVLIWDSFADSNEVNYWAKDRYAVMPRTVIVATGDEQVTSFGELLARIDAEDGAVARAKARVEQRDDDAEPDEPDDEPDEDETEPEDEGDAIAAELGIDEPEDEDEEDGEDEDEPDEDEEDEEDEESEDDPDAERRAELDAMKTPALKAALEAAGLVISEFRGVAKADVIQAIIDAERESASNAKKSAPARKGAAKTTTRAKFRAADED